MAYPGGTAATCPAVEKAFTGIAPTEVCRALRLTVVRLMALGRVPSFAGIGSPVSERMLLPMFTGVGMLTAGVCWGSAGDGAETAASDGGEVVGTAAGTKAVKVGGAVGTSAAAAAAATGSVASGAVGATSVTGICTGAGDTDCDMAGAQAIQLSSSC